MIAAAIGVVVVSGLLVSRRTSVKDFCNSSQSGDLTKVEFNGQGRHAILTDRAALDYLVRAPRLRELPVGEQLTNGLSFDAKLSGEWGRIQMLFGLDHRVIRLTFFDSFFFGEEFFVFIVVEPNAPLKLRELISFLLDESKRERTWSG